MKINPDCFRDILIAIESLPFDHNALGLDVPGYSEEEIYYHLQLLDDAGFVVLQYFSTSDNPLGFYVERLTYQGHEFLEASRDNDAWSHVKTVFRKSGTFVLSIAQALLIDYLKGKYLPMN